MKESTVTTIEYNTAGQEVLRVEVVRAWERDLGNVARGTVTTYTRRTTYGPSGEVVRVEDETEYE